MTSTATTTAKTTTSAREVEALVREALPLVGHIVRETLARVPAHICRDDLTSAGMAALVTAAQGYDPDRGIPFPRFASSRIRGALLDELRGLDWASRSVRSRARRLEGARAELTASLGRTPTSTEIAQTLGVATTEIGAVEDDVQRAVVLSLQGFTAGTAEDMVIEKMAGPEDMLIHRERIGYLTDAIDALPDRLRTVITSYFLNERPMAEIAAELGVTESRISQLRAEALLLLRDGLNSQLNPDALTPAKRAGRVADRRENYYNTIAATSTLNTRLARTTTLGMPHTAIAA